ncbi:hypothetical protein [Lysobacter gummosus]|uniref:hypothetical protein n=1 Tax=Lysobacter gummosus TaxID=262324 RepID=UPI0036378411
MRGILARLLFVKEGRNCTADLLAIAFVAAARPAPSLPLLDANGGDASISRAC